jgi:hypothetical protein
VSANRNELQRGTDEHKRDRTAGSAIQPFSTAGRAMQMTCPSGWVLLAAHALCSVLQHIFLQMSCHVELNYTGPQVWFGSREPGNCLARPVQWLEDPEAYDVVPFQEEARSCSCWPAGCIIESLLHVTTQWTLRPAGITSRRSSLRPAHAGGEEEAQ